MADLTLPDPLAVLDVADWLQRPPTRDFLVALNEWTDRHGIEARDAVRIEVYLIDTLFARVFQYARTERGHLYCGVDHDHLDEPERCEAARRLPYLVPLTCMPPEFSPATTTEEMP
ncbi:hypothetical protein AB0C10_37660 [Microbispora amethystogenes]|uniref:hypothetical protein n=1 Tax=Microbispora amethystogenes TaxID=1427754 RepID=UPI0033D5E7C7